MASGRNGTLYVGVTSDLQGRVYQHKNDLIPGFTRKWQVHRLVYYETHGDILEAIAAEKRLKKWKRLWKIRLIEKINPQWRDLYEDLARE
jgi:putative endonuclease